MGEERATPLDEEGLIERLRYHGLAAQPGETISATFTQAAQALTALRQRNAELESLALSWKSEAANEFLKRQSAEAQLSLAVEALRPFAEFSAALKAKPLRGVDDEFYGIHTGTEWEASLRFSQIHAAAAFLSSLEGNGRRQTNVEAQCADAQTRPSTGAGVSEGGG
jgi:hypothetical protein